LNIALFPSSFHPHIGGVESMCRELALQLKQRGHNPIILTNRWPKDLPEQETLDGIPVHRFIFRVPERNWRQLGGSLLYGPATLRAVKRTLREHHTDLMHLHCVSSNAHYALAAKRALKIPLVITTHAELTMDATQLFQHSQFAQELMHRALTQADAVTACASHTLQQAEKFLGASLAGKSQVVFNGAPALENVAPHSHPKSFILAIGRLVPQKGIDLLLRAIDSVADFDLLIAGDGPERGALEQLKDSLPSGARIHFLGPQSRPQIHALLKGAAAFILPSRTDEGMPMVLLEALAAGKPILATRSGGTEELLASAALFAEKGNLASLTAQLQKLLGDETLRQGLSRKAAARARDFDWGNITTQYESIYTRLTAAQNKSKIENQKSKIPAHA
jgi:glycosyltransferase involved in cell wall biosynthesis